MKRNLEDQKLNAVLDFQCFQLSRNIFDLKKTKKKAAALYSLEKQKFKKGSLIYDDKGLAHT